MASLGAGAGILINQPSATVPPRVHGDFWAAACEKILRTYQVVRAPICDSVQVRQSLVADCGAAVSASVVSGADTSIGLGCLSTRINKKKLRDQEPMCGEYKQLNTSVSDTGDEVFFSQELC